MSFFHIALIVGPALAALLVLHQIVCVKIDNDAILRAYRDLRLDGKRRKKTSNTAETKVAGDGETLPAEAVGH